MPIVDHDEAIIESMSISGTSGNPDGDQRITQHA